MSIPASSAAAAYLNAARNAAAGAPAAAGDVKSGDFGEFLKSALEGVADTAKQGDKMMLAQAAGKADMVDVVTAVAETELTVRTLVTVRDRVIGAYQEIMRMPI